MAGQQGGNLYGRRDESGRRANGGILASPSIRSPGHRSLASSILHDTGRLLVGDAALVAGIPLGVARGAYHMGKDIIDGAVDGGRFVADLVRSDAARAAARDGVARAGAGVLDYTKNAVSHPKAVVDDVGALLHDAGDSLRDFRMKVDPNARPPADNLWDEATRNFKVGLNQGEAAFDVGSLLLGGAEARAAAGLGRLSKEALVAKNVARGYSKPVARYFAEPYSGMGHHYVPRSTKLPAWLGGGPIPRVISDSLLNVLKPRNMSKGEFFELHVGVDPQYYGGKISKKYGGGSWSGRKLGWTKYGKLRRHWDGSPKPLKYVAGSGIFGSIGALVDPIYNGEEQP